MDIFQFSEPLTLKPGEEVILHVIGNPPAGSHVVGCLLRPDVTGEERGLPLGARVYKIGNDGTVKIPASDFGSGPWGFVEMHSGNAFEFRDNTFIPEVRFDSSHVEVGLAAQIGSSGSLLHIGTKLAMLVKVAAGFFMATALFLGQHGFLKAQSHAPRQDTPQAEASTQTPEVSQTPEYESSLSNPYGGGRNNWLGYWEQASPEDSEKILNSKTIEYTFQPQNPEDFNVFSGAHVDIKGPHENMFFDFYVIKTPQGWKAVDERNKPVPFQVDIKVEDGKLIVSFDGAAVHAAAQRHKIKFIDKLHGQTVARQNEMPIKPGRISKPVSR